MNWANAAIWGGAFVVVATARRKFFELADIAANARRGKDAPPISPLALEAVRRIDAVFDLERAINGAHAAHRLAVRQADAAPLVAELGRWMRAERERLSRHAPVAKAMNYMLSRWPSFTRFLEDGRMHQQRRLLSARCAERPSAARHGSSPDPSAAATGPPSCTR